MHRPSHVESAREARLASAREARLPRADRAPDALGYPTYPTLSYTLRPNAGGARRGAASDAKVAFSDLGDGTTRQIQMRQARRAAPAALRMRVAGACKPGCAHSHHAASR